MTVGDMPRMLSIDPDEAGSWTQTSPRSASIWPSD